MYRRLLVPCLFALAFFLSWVIYAIVTSDATELKSTIQSGASNFVFLLAGIVGTYFYGTQSQATANDAELARRIEAASQVMLAVKAAVMLPCALLFSTLLSNNITNVLYILSESNQITFYNDGFRDIQIYIGGTVFLSAMLPSFSLFMYHAGSVSRNVSYIALLLSTFPSIPLIGFLISTFKIATGGTFFVELKGFLLACLLAVLLSFFAWASAKFGHFMNWRQG